MAHELRALIADKGRLTELAKELRSAAIIDLCSGLALLPLNKDLLAELKAKGAGKAPFEGLTLPQAVAEWAKAGSASGPIAYIETDYRKGKDHQAGLVWSEGEVLTGPLTDDTAWDPRESPLQDRPVNKALRTLGVKPGASGDEWDAAGMSRHRRTEEWI